jgi:hypothetical protein
MTASTHAHSLEILARPHSCAACGRRFVVVGVVGVGRSPKPRCGCGAALAESGLAPGVYEIRAAPRDPGALPVPRAQAAPKRPPAAERALPKEPDLGYGESHGYGPAHGGPSGPGDAPATEITEVTPAAAKAKPADKQRRPS